MAKCKKKKRNLIWKIQNVVYTQATAAVVVVNNNEVQDSGTSLLHMHSVVV